jgi:L-threonylcarbamoyladenylate synthase
MVNAMTQLLRIEDPAGWPAIIEAAVRILGAGGIVALPTDTVYGLAADPRIPRSLQTLVAVKGRDAGKPIALLIDDVSRLAAWNVDAGGLIARLAAAFWPGPLTLVAATRGGDEGFRVPDHEFARRLLTACGGALRVSSANRSGAPPALTAQDALEALADDVELVLDGGRVGGGVASTVVRVTDGKLEVLR